MLIGWFSQSVFDGPLLRYTGGLTVRRNHCIYAKPNGGYAVITQVGQHTAKPPSNAKLVGEVTQCLIDVASPFAKMAELDQDKLASAASEVGLTIQEVLGQVSKKPPIKINPEMLKMLKSIGVENGDS